jgi:acetyl/propionyl-CoA carboxylase alpha subunit
MVMRYTVTVDGDIFEIEVGREGRAWINQEPCEVDLQHVGGNGEYSLLLDNRSYDIHVDGSASGRRCVTIGGRPYRTRLQRGGTVCGNGQEGVTEGGDGAQDGPACQVEMRAPLPGLLVELHARKGDHVGEQDVVAVLESMKMNLEIRAPRGGLVRDLLATPGQQVAQDELLVVIRPNVASYGDENA